MLASGRNLSLLKQFTYMHPKDLVMHFQKMVIVYYTMVYCFGNIRVWIQKILLNFCWVSILFWYFNCSDLMNGGSDPCKPYHFLKECNENFQMQYVNCFNRLTDHKSGRKHETRQITPFFLSTFSTVTVCNIHFSIWK